MWKWIEMLLSFVVGRLMSRGADNNLSALVIFDIIAEKSRKMAVLFLAGLGMVILFAGGLFILMMDLTAQYDANAEVYASATSISAGVLLVVTGGILAYVFSRVWPKMTKEKVHIVSSQPAAHPGFQEALAVLVMDIVKEREFSRKQNATAGSAPSSEPYYPPQQPAPRRSSPEDSPSSTTRGDDEVTLQENVLH